MSSVTFTFATCLRPTSSFLPSLIAGSLRRAGQRLALLDDVGGEHLGDSAALGLPVMDDAGRNEEALARLHGDRRLALDHERQRPLDQVTDFLTGEETEIGRAHV